MARHRVVTADAEIDAGLARTADEPHVVSALFAAGLNALVLNLSNGKRSLIPREDLEGMESATDSELSNIEILGPGTGLHWPDLDLDFSVAGLLRGVYGSSQWMARIGKKGGRSKTVVKQAAAKLNGSKGGRPKEVRPAARKRDCG
jgi:hypothetical protein